MSYGYDIIQQDDGWYFRDPSRDEYEGPYETQKHAGMAKSWWYA